jgi:hypothetical protein
MRHLIPHYIGVTGIQAVAEVLPIVAAAAASAIGPKHSHNLMLGALVSPSTVHNHLPSQTTKPFRHISSRETLVDILREANKHGIVGMIHFELHKTWPGTASDGEAVLELLRYLASHDLHPAVQLNGVLLPHDILKIHREGKVQIVLQLRKELAEQGRGELLRYISEVSPAVSTILMDPSAGAGATIDLKHAMSLTRDIEERHPKSFHFGFAGGLGGANSTDIERTSTLVSELSRNIPHGAFSVDAETRVRVKIDDTEIDRLDIDLCSLYFQAVRAGLH